MMKDDTFPTKEMAFPTLPGTWRGFLEQGSGSGIELSLESSEDTQPPSQPTDTDELPNPNPAPNVSPMTLDELLLAPGRSHLPKLDPKRSNGAGWFGYTKGITKSIKNIMENDFPHTAPNWTLLEADTKIRWFKTFAQKYNWDYCHTTHVRENFDALCASRLLDRVYEWKKSWRTGKGKPNWMNKTAWAGFLVYWTIEKNANRSKTNSENRMSDRKGYGISKHTSGSCPYVRLRENMRDEETGKLPDMVKFMETTHKRKKDGVFVDKKAEAIAKKCRILEAQKLTQMTEDDTCFDTELTETEKEAIYRTEVGVKNGRCFGYGAMEIEFPSAPAIADNSPDYKELYMETQTKLMEATNKIDELSSQVEDAVFWSNMMRSMYPNHVPPSQSGRQASVTPNAPNGS